MGQSGKIEVELKLLLDKAKQDAKSFFTNFKKEAQGASGQSSSSGESPIDKTTRAVKKTKTAMDDAAASAKKWRQEMLAAWRAANPSGLIPGQKIYGLGEQHPSNPNVGTDSTLPGSGGKPWTTSAGGGLATKPPGLAPAVAATKSSLSSMLSIAAQVSMVLVGLRVAMGLLMFVVRHVVNAFRVLLRSMENAARNYAGAVTSGMPMGVAIEWGNIAKVLGVATHDAMLFGQAAVDIGNNLRIANQTMKETTPILTAMHWRWMEMKENIAALVAQFTATLAPAITGFLQVLNAQLKTELIYGFVKALGELANTLLGLAVLLLKVEATLQMALKGIAQMIADFVNGIVNRKFDFSKTEAIGEAIKEMWRRQSLEAPVAPAMARRGMGMGFSAWERMGLVIGRGPGTNYAAQTARATERAARGIETLVRMGLPRSSIEGNGLNFNSP